MTDGERHPTGPLALVLDGSSGDLGLLGGKGASLDRLIAWGLPVPPTGVVSTRAYREMAADPAIAALIDAIRAGATPSADEVDSVVAGWVAPDAVRSEVMRVARAVGDGRPLAVRSSATVEDLGTSSFAGQYVSVLDVDADDPDAVLGAVGRVFASLWHPAPCAYRRAFGISEDAVAMATVLMRMVPARRAGVVFTEDPGGRRGAARIEVVEGLAESLVSGRRTPDPFVVPRDAPGDVPPEVAEALQLALEVERRAGTPQDVEWAWDGHATILVQARPITVGADAGDGFDSATGEDELTTAAIGETLPGVLAPLTWQLASHLVDEAFHRVLDDLAVLTTDRDDALLVRRVRGRAALDFSQLRAMADQLPGGAGEDLELQYFGSRRRGRPSAGTGERPRVRRRRLRSAMHDLRVLATRRRVVQDADTVDHAVDALLQARPEVSALGVDELLAYRARLVDLGVRGSADQLAVAAIAVSAFGRLESTLVPYLGRQASAAAAERATASAGVSCRPPVEASAAVFAGPTWQELGIRSAVPDAPEDPQAALDEAIRELELELDACPRWRSQQLRHHVRVTALERLTSDVVAQLRRRERTKVAVLSLGGEVRRVQLELGRRLCDVGVLAEPTQVDLLSDAELRDAVRDHPPSAVLLAQRRRWVERYESEGPLPPRFRGAPDRAPAQLPAGDRLEGWATSPGRARATAKVVRSAVDTLEPGLVLVAEATDASWSPLFVDAAAIVLERGGPLSHAAILARELGVPAVLNVAGATSLLDGRDVLVDGDAGIVVVTDDGSVT